MPLVTSPGITGKPKEQERHERLALNLFDLDRMDEFLRERLFQNNLDVDGVENLDPKKKEATIIPLKGSLLYNATAIDVVRSEQRKYNEPVIRSYVKRGNVWSPVRFHEVLTQLKDGKAVLNPLFWDDVLEEEPLPPK